MEWKKNTFNNKEKKGGGGEEMRGRNKNGSEETKKDLITCLI